MMTVSDAAGDLLSVYPGSMLGQRTDADYEIVAVIGRGAYGTVYKARDRRNDGRCKNDGHKTNF